MTHQISKRIIQVWGGPRPLPHYAKAAEINAKALHPDFEYILINDSMMDDIIKRQCHTYQRAYHNFPYKIQKYDFIRYLAIYELGGFYLDADLLLTRSLSDLLKNGCVFSFEMLTINYFLRQEYGMDWEVGNYAFGATPGHPFIAAVIENCVRGQIDRTWAKAMMRGIPSMFSDEFAVVQTTGPGLVSRTLAEYPNAANEVKVLFPADVCNSETWRLFGDYGVHLMMGMWRQRGRGLRTRLLNHWWRWEEQKMLREAQKRGPTRALDFRRRERRANVAIQAPA